MLNAELLICDQPKTIPPRRIQTDDVVGTGCRRMDDVVGTGCRRMDDIVGTGCRRMDDVVGTGCRRMDDVVGTGCKHMTLWGPHGVVRTAWRRGDRL
ncbi:hypothetical protein EYF80_022629 [Liparis tanakae]|uniref:Uncharacterized protein n=1 Tax=Liparis tanakae TaxID=230148 RepID=A0A4Z2HMJ8_9TELE|nr:hypothetical protein EYF80_022629 [Liparis tanakae]